MTVIGLVVLYGAGDRVYRVYTVLLTRYYVCFVIGNCE